MPPLPAVVYREHSLGPAPGQTLVNGLVIFLAICTILHFGADILIPVALAILLSILLAPMVGAAAPAAAEGGGGDGRARRAELLGGAFRLCTPPTAPRAAPATAARLNRCSRASSRTRPRAAGACCGSAISARLRRRNTPISNGAAAASIKRFSAVN